MVSRKSLRLSGEARTQNSNGQLITHISGDASFMVMDFSVYQVLPQLTGHIVSSGSSWNRYSRRLSSAIPNHHRVGFHFSSLLPEHFLKRENVSVFFSLGILIHIIGYSALVGMGVLLVGIPAQTWLFTKLMHTRQEQMKIVDSRVKVLQEIFQGVRVIKFMAYEAYFERRIMQYRKKELGKVKKNAIVGGMLHSFFKHLYIVLNNF